MSKTFDDSRKIGQRSSPGCRGSLAGVGCVSEVQRTGQEVQDTRAASRWHDTHACV